MATSTAPVRAPAARDEDPARGWCSPSARRRWPADLALLAARIVLAWIFIYYGAGKLFGAFNGPGSTGRRSTCPTSPTCIPGGFFAVLGGLIEFGGGIAMALGLLARLAGLALSATW